MSDTAPETTPVPETTPTPSITADTGVVVHDAERDTRPYLHELLAWLKAKFEAVGLDIKKEIDKM